MNLDFSIQICLLYAHFCLQIIKPHFHIKIDSFKFVFEHAVNLCAVRVLHERRTSALRVLCENTANGKPGRAQ